MKTSRLLVSFYIALCAGILFCISACRGDIAEKDMQENTDGLETKAPAVEWHKGYGTDNGEHIHEIMETNDGGFIGIGQTSEDGDDWSDILVIKTDSNGDFLWQRIIGTKGKFDVGICLAEVSDGYLIGGGLHHSDQDRYLAKLHFTGETVWEKVYENPGQDMIRGIALADDGDILLTGYKGASEAGYIFIADDSEGFVMRLSPEGLVRWEKNLSTAQGAKIRKTNEGYVICTTHWMNDPDHPQEMYLIRLDEEGNEIWARNYGGDSDEHCYDCDVTSDGGVILGGHSRSPSYGLVNWDFLLMKVDGSGDLEWYKTFGQPRGYNPEFIHDEAYGVRQTPDGGYIIVGGTGDEYPYSESGHPSGKSDIWQVYVVQVDHQGDLMWEAVYGHTQVHNAGEYMDLTRDGGFIIGTDSDSAGDDEFEPNNFGFLKIK